MAEHSPAGPCTDRSCHLLGPRQICMQQPVLEDITSISEIPSVFVHIPPIDITNRPAIIQTIGTLVDWTLTQLSSPQAL